MTLFRKLLKLEYSVFRIIQDWKNACQIHPEGIRTVKS